MSSPSTHAAGLCAGKVGDAVKRCPPVSWRSREIGVAPYMDLTTTKAPEDEQVTMASANTVRSRLSHFNEASLKWDAGSAKLVRDTSDDTFCPYTDGDAIASFDCDGKHFCPPDTASAAGDSFMDRCFNDRISGTTPSHFGMSAETGIPPPGDWNRAGWKYEDALLDTHSCDLGDALSENILFAVDDDENLRCLYSQADKLLAVADGGGAKITVATPASGEATELYQQHVMFYAPVHVFDEVDGVAYQYTIRATLPMFWGLLVGVMDTSDNLPPDVTFAFKEEGKHINLAYVWDGVSNWEPPLTTTDADGNHVNPGDPHTYVIGTIMNLRYHGVVFDCVNDDAPCTAGAAPAHSSPGITNLEERAFKFTTRVTIDRTTVGGLIDAETAISGAALTISLSASSTTSSPCPTGLYRGRARGAVRHHDAERRLYH